VRRKAQLGHQLARTLISVPPPPPLTLLIVAAAKVLNKVSVSPHASVSGERGGVCAVPSIRTVAAALHLLLVLLLLVLRLDLHLLPSLFLPVPCSEGAGASCHLHLHSSACGLASLCAFLPGYIPRVVYPPHKVSIACGARCCVVSWLPSLSRDLCMVELRSAATDAEIAVKRVVAPVRSSVVSAPPAPASSPPDVAWVVSVHRPPPRFPLWRRCAQ
jgi:hypothetical protein